MEELGIYLQIGFKHIMSWNAWDHILFVLVLTLRYQWVDWKKLVVLITSFTIGHSITNAIVTALSVLPGIGTAVSAMNSAAKMSEELIKTCGEPIAKIGGISKKISKTVKHQTDILDCEMKKVTKLFDNIGKPKVGGGGAVTRKNIKKNIQKTTKRVNYMLKQFANKKKKINYTQRLRRF